MQLDLADGGEDEAAGAPATGVSGALPGISKARTGGSKPLGAAGHNLVAITPAMKQMFLQEEFQRYAKPTEFFTYTGNDGRRVLMAPLKCAPCPPTSPLTPPSPTSLAHAHTHARARAGRCPPPAGRASTTCCGRRGRRT